MQPMQITDSSAAKQRRRNRYSWSPLSGRKSSDNIPRCISLLFLAVLACILLWHVSTRITDKGTFEDEDDDVFAKTPFCDADGTCHESPNVASPRTIYSARSRQQYDQWWRFHAHLNQTAAAFPQATRPLVFLGDSITEAWLGTGMGDPKERARGVPQVLDAWMRNSKIQWDPLVLAISGDQTQHLLWRLEHGELTTSVAENAKALFVVLIGTNNLGSGELPEPTAEGVLAVVDYLISTVKGKILVLQLLPRGDGPTWLPDLCPPRCDKNRRSYTSFFPAIDKVNAAVMKGFDERYLADANLRDRLDLINCGDAFLQNIPSGEQVDTSLMPDRLHPNAAGHERLAECIAQWMDGHIVL